MARLEWGLMGQADGDGEPAIEDDLFDPDDAAAGEDGEGLDDDENGLDNDEGDAS